MPELITILIGASPFAELRGAIPLALFGFKFAAIKAYFLGVFGNLLPVAPLLLFWMYPSDFLMRRSYFLNRFLSWLFRYTREKHAAHFEKHHHHHFRNFWLSLALFIFVAIPLPFTGAWSGTVAAFVFGIPFWWAFGAISLGVLTSGLIMTLASLGLLIL